MIKQTPCLERIRELGEDPENHEHFEYMGYHGFPLPYIFKLVPGERPCERTSCIHNMHHFTPVKYRGRARDDKESMNCMCLLDRPMTNEEIAQTMGTVSRQRVDQIVHKALGHMKRKIPERIRKDLDELDSLRKGGDAEAEENIFDL